MESFTIPRGFQATQFEQDMAELHLHKLLRNCVLLFLPICAREHFIVLQEPLRNGSLSLNQNKKIITVGRDTEPLKAIPVLKNKNVHLNINYDH